MGGLGCWTVSKLTGGVSVVVGGVYCRLPNGGNRSMTNARKIDDYSDATNCAFCDVELFSNPTLDGEHGIWTAHCPNCGKYRITSSAYRDLVDDWQVRKPDYLPLVSHKVRLRQRRDTPTYIDTYFLQEIFDGELEFPSAIEQVENLVIYLAETLLPGDEANLSYRTCQAIAGATGPTGFSWVLKSAHDIGWVQGEPTVILDGPFALLQGSLTIDGWKWYNEIGRHKHSNIAFMAMPYGEEPLTSIVDEHFKPAVKQTGFDLMRLDDRPKAGIIDNRLRVEIRRSRFLISDITNDNHGAIWEAGFAEGLGRPVIYTCEAGKLKEKHFDIRNCQMVPWNRDAPDKAAEMLKATIRNTLPDEAILDDPEPVP